MAHNINDRGYSAFDEVPSGTSIAKVLKPRVHTTSVTVANPTPQNIPQNLRGTSQQVFNNEYPSGPSGPSGPAPSAPANTSSLSMNAAESRASIAATVAAYTGVDPNNPVDVAMAFFSPVGAVLSEAVHGIASSIVSSSPASLEGAAIVADQGPPAYTNDDEMSAVEALQAARSKQSIEAAFSKKGLSVRAANVQAAFNKSKGGSKGGPKGGPFGRADSAGFGQPGSGNDSTGLGNNGSNPGVGNMGGIGSGAPDDSGDSPSSSAGPSPGVGQGGI
tara:strand:- start:8136 stop:8963 length:828 start_codon:yes stop_codon:yes gene_type:complete